tara:strand:+ start:2035 stop:2454 length:420 start_codon:yes stop_codon:yes gene_type:complete
MSELSLKKYKNKYISLKQIYRTIRKELIFGKQLSYSMYYKIITTYLTEVIKQVAVDKEKFVLPKSLGKLYIKKMEHKRPFHVQIDINESERTGKIIRTKIPILTDYYNKLVWERPVKYKTYKVLPLRRFKSLINAVNEY